MFPKTKAELRASDPTHLNSAQLHWQLSWVESDRNTPLYTIQRVVKPVEQSDNRLNVCLHDAAGCSTGCLIGLRTGWTVSCMQTFNRLFNGLCGLTTAVKQPAASCKQNSTGCQTGWTTGLTTGWMFVYSMQPVIQPVWQPVVSCKRGLRVVRASGALWALLTTEKNWNRQKSAHFKTFLSVVEFRTFSDFLRLSWVLSGAVNRA